MTAASIVARVVRDRHPVYARVAGELAAESYLELVGRVHEAAGRAPRPADEVAALLALAHLGAALGASRLALGATATDFRLLRLAHRHPDTIPVHERCHALSCGVFENPVTFYASRDPVGILGRPPASSINWLGIAVGLAREYRDVAVWLQPAELSTGAAASLLVTRPHQADLGLGFEPVPR